MTFEYDFIDGWIIRDRTGYVPTDEVSKATVFALANGYMSSRGAPESISPQASGVVGHYINGIYDSPTDGILDREIINIPAWTPIYIEIDGKPLNLEGDALQDYVRSLDLRQGLMQQSMTWLTKNGVTVKVLSERLVSMARPHLAAIHWQITVDEDCDVTIKSAIDSQVSNRFAETHFENIVIGENSITTKTIERNYRVCVLIDHVVNVEGEQHCTDHKLEDVYAFSMSAGDSIEFTKFAAVYDSRFSPGVDLEECCRQELENAQTLDYSHILQEHTNQWAKLWESSDMIIEGDEKAQIAIRFCLFHLLANLPHSDQVSISARGLQGQDYWGSIFWDCEIYVLPFFTYTQPEYARRSLQYRYHTLNGARRKAQDLKYEGAFYAWQSQETGDETCALYVFDDPFTGKKIRSYFADEQIHISADIVYALWQYFQATNDFHFLAQSGLEIICEVARFFASRVTLAQDNYHLLSVLGPDEYHERVDNNAYTNVLAQYVLQIAIDVLKLTQTEDAQQYDRVLSTIGLTQAEIDTWRDIQQKLIIPEPDPEKGLISQFDGYFELEDVRPDVVRTRLKHPDQYPGGLAGPYQATQSIKQADIVLLLYLMRSQYEQKTKTANWHYYEPRTAHDSSLSPMAYALVAADTGMIDWAYRYFMQTAMMDLLGTGPHWNLGVHTAAMGGAWLAVVHGFCQIDLRSDGVHLLNWPRLPEHWERVSFTFYWRGLRVQFETDGKTTTLKTDSTSIPVFYPGGYEMSQIVRIQHQQVKE